MAIVVIMRVYSLPLSKLDQHSSLLLQYHSEMSSSDIMGRLTMMA